MTDDGGLTADHIKHLELIQPVVARLANNSFLIKGWALTVVAGFLALLTTGRTWGFAAAGLVPLLAFWGLDGLFLRQERMFRRLYEEVRSGSTAVPLFSMDVSAVENGPSWWRSVTSTTLLAFYGTLALVDLVLLVATLPA